MASSGGGGGPIAALVHSPVFVAFWRAVLGQITTDREAALAKASQAGLIGDTPVAMAALARAATLSDILHRLDHFPARAEEAERTRNGRQTDKPLGTNTTPGYGDTI